MTLEEIGIAATDRFIEGFNSRDPHQFAASLNYPNVRPSPHAAVGEAATAADYAAAQSYDRVLASGWVRSAFDYQRFLAGNEDKIHVAGQWSRYNDKGETILTTPVTYVVTNIQGRWGIQSRFGSDSVRGGAQVGEGASELGDESAALVREFIDSMGLDDATAIADCLHFPHYVIGVGEFRRTDSLDAAGDLNLAGVSIVDINIIQSGNTSANLEVRLKHGEDELHGVVNLVHREGRLGIQAWSTLRPS